jgi:hypothetical protein
MPGRDPVGLLPAGRTINDCTTSNGNDDATDQHAKLKPQMKSAAAAAAAVLRSGTSRDTVYEYSLNALSAALTQQSPVNMSSFVTMVEDDYAPFAKLSEVRKGHTIATALTLHLFWAGGSS